MNKKEKFNSLFDVKNGITDVIKHGELTQIYKGPIVNGCYHGQGLMIWIEKNEKQIYKGYFYVNRIHGYGRMSYANGTIFEGLFKENMRFGPGVMTHPNDFQEVGFWIGTRLLRITHNFTTNMVPSFDTSYVSTKIKLLQFRDLIDIAQPPHSIINVRDDNEKYLNYNYSYSHMRHLNSLFFDTQAFDVEFMSKSTVMPVHNLERENRFICGNSLEDLILKNYLKISKDTSQSNKVFLLNCGIGIDNKFEFLNHDTWTIKNQRTNDVELNKSKPNEKESENQCKNGEVHINCLNILAYNNNTLDKMILSHAYQQRFGEKTLHFDIDNIWNGKRNIFMRSQSQESAAIRLLGKLEVTSDDLQNLILNYDIDVDVADSRGNTRLMISSANDQHEIIKCLINLDANLECYNDDGFTPLNLNLMRYICALNDIDIWTEYIIPNVNLKLNIKKGVRDITLKNIQKTNFFMPENFANLKFIGNDGEIENTIPSAKSSKKTKQTILDPIEKTLVLITDMGARATTCSIPKTSIHLALLTINPTILKAAFKAGGSSSYTLSDEDFKLNLLHMAVMMPISYNLIRCIEVLIMHNVDPNSKAFPIFKLFRHKLPWKILRNEKASMTPLDILCLKDNDNKLNEKLVIDEKLESELVSILNDITEKSHTFCGFKPVALAMLTGKLHLVKKLLEKNRNAVNEIIPNFGTLLTLLLNPFYNNNLSYKKINEILDLLLKMKANPFKIVKISNQKFRGNVYNYCYMLFKPEMVNKVSNLSNFNETIENLKIAGRANLDKFYAKRAKSILLYNYDKQRSTPLPDDKTNILLWLDSSFEIIKNKFIENVDHQPFNNKTVIQRDEENKKNETYKLCLQQIKKDPIIRSTINISEEESQVCYECLKHSKEMEICSTCYFALLCSERCKNYHKKQSCLVKIRRNHITQMQNEIKYNKIVNKMNENKLYELSKISNSFEKTIENVRNNNHIYLSSMSLLPSKTLSTSLLSLQLKPSTSLIRKNMLISDYSNNFYKQSQNEMMDIKLLQKYQDSKKFKDRRNDSLLVSTLSSDSNTSKSNTSSLYSLSSIALNAKTRSINSIMNKQSEKKSAAYSDSNKPLKNKPASKLNDDKPLKNKPTENLDGSLSSMTETLNTSKQNHPKMKHKNARSQEQRLVSKNQLNDDCTRSVNYKLVRSPGCWRPTFMFINRGSTENTTIFNDLIKYSQVDYQNDNNQYGILYNYSLI